MKILEREWWAIKAKLERTSVEKKGAEEVITSWEWVIDGIYLFNTAIVILIFACEMLREVARAYL